LGKPESDVIHPQLIMDVQPEPEQGGKTVIGISPAVMNRLFSGKTKGLAFYAQGALNASFASSESPVPNNRPVLYFNVNKEF
jgi:hypothetical protein